MKSFFLKFNSVEMYGDDCRLYIFFWEHIYVALSNHRFRIIIDII